MPDVIIRRCTLRVVRRHGWSWGPGPDRLLKAAVAALPLLLARKLGALFLEASDRDLTERISITVPVNLSELLELSVESSLAADIIESRAAAAFEERLATALNNAFPREVVEVEASAPDHPSDTPPVDFERERREEAVQAHRVLSMLVNWKHAGELEIHLSAFSEQELQAWYRAVAATVVQLAAEHGKLWQARISRLINELDKRLQVSATDQTSKWRIHLNALVGIGEQLQLRSNDETSLQAVFEELIGQLGLNIDEAAPERLALSTQSDLPVEISESTVFASQQSAPVTTPAPRNTLSRVKQTEFHLRSVLPFLLLGPLSKIGYLDALPATLDTVGLSSQAPLFATALAYKVLTPPARGWHRDKDDVTVASVFAGLETAPPGEALAELARKLSGHLNPLDSLLAYTLVKGHSPDAAMLLQRTREDESSGLILMDPEGLFPVAWASDLKSLLPTLRYFKETHLLIEQASADVETLRELHGFGFLFITDAPPTRGETWREVRRSSRARWYTNDSVTKQTKLARIAEELTRYAEEAALFWQALKLDRPAIPTARHSELERSVTMAVSLALGTISWMLWRKRETLTPILALERFGNLAGKVRFSSDAVQVRLPLGQRHSDLYDHGLLADVHNVPWLAGRKVEFFGG